MPLLLLLLSFLLLGPAAQAQPVTIPDRVRTAAEGITADRLGRDLDYLASDELLGRDTPSPGFDQAAAYIVRRLEQAGLKPLGDDGTFLQYYEMRESRVDVVGAYLEIEGRRFGLGDDFVMRSFAGPLSGTRRVVYVGHGWTVPGRGIDPYAGLDLRGRIVLAHGPRALPKDVEIQQLGRVSVGASSPVAEAERRGAAGIIYIGQTAALTGWERMRDANTIRREMKPAVPSAYAAPPVTSVLLAPHVTEALLAGERLTGTELIERGNAADYPASFELATPVTLHIPVAASTLHHPYNLVAVIKGGDPVLKHEYVTIASHLDGAVGAQAVNGDAIYNAADDNASGSAVNLAIAEAMTQAPRPKRSLIFIWDSGEEQGLWGTRWFVHRPPVPLDRIVAHLNIDMVGANRAPGSPDEHSPDVTGPNEVYLVGPGVLSERADVLLEAVNRAYLNLRFNRRYDRADSEFFYPRTDAGPFLERGILTIGFFTGLHDRYHLPSDQAQHLDPMKMEAIARTIFAGLWMLADADERPGIDRDIPELVPRYGPSPPE
jgi:hypothetical protein